MKNEYEGYRQDPRTFRIAIWKYISDPYEGGEVTRLFFNILENEELGLIRKTKDVFASSIFRGIIVVAIVGFSIVSLKKENENNLLKVFVDNLESIGIASTAIIFILEIPDRRKQYHYQAWQVVNSAQLSLNEDNLSPSSGRIQALQDLVNENVDLKGISAPNSVLEGIDLRYGKLKNSNFKGAQLNDSDLRNADFSGANLSGANLQDAQLMDSNLIGANLFGADLRGANLSSANLHSAILQKADMSTAKLTHAILKAARMQDSFMSGTDLKGADLRGANLAGVADISDEQISSAMLCGTVLPDGIHVEQIHCTVIEILVGDNSIEVGEILNP